jgi:hypothetical protein
MPFTSRTCPWDVPWPAPVSCCSQVGSRSGPPHTAAAALLGVSGIDDEARDDEPRPGQNPSDVRLKLRRFLEQARHSTGRSESLVYDRPDYSRTLRAFIFCR